MITLLMYIVVVLHTNINACCNRVVFMYIVMCFIYVVVAPELTVDSYIHV